MKRLLTICLLVVLILLAFSGCEEREVIAFEYTSEILIEKECPSEDIVWAGRFETPRKSGGILTYSDSRFFGIVDDQQIEVIKLSQEKNYFKPFANNVNANLSKLLGISREKLRAKFDVAVDEINIQRFEDVMLIHFFVPEDDVYNDKPTEYAGQYVFIEYRNKEKTSQIVAVAPNEYADVNNPHRLRTACEGRIGNVYYLCDGYYDLSTHTYKRYENESELPKYEMRHFMSNKEILEIARQDKVLSGYLNDDNIYYAERYYRFNDRIYAAFVTGDNWYDEYNGSELLLVMLDADSNEVLYAEKYHSSNYYMGAATYVIAMYRRGSDGCLYDPFIEK